MWITRKLLRGNSDSELFFLCFCLCGTGRCSHNYTCCGDRDFRGGVWSALGFWCLFLWAIISAEHLRAETLWSCFLVLIAFKGPITTKPALWVTCLRPISYGCPQKLTFSKDSRWSYECGRSLSKRVYPWDGAVPHFSWPAEKAQLAVSLSAQLYRHHLSV